MLDQLAERFSTAVARLRRLERRELKGFRAWLENTQNLIHVSILVFVPLLIGAVSLLSVSVQQISFLLFPPLASATYTLFSDPEGKFAAPWRFVGGLTVGALCGWLALEIGLLVNHVPTVGALEVDAAGAAFAVFLAGAMTWALDLEEPAAFSTALLTLVTKTTALAYLASVFLSSAFVAGVFVLWRRHFFERRASYLYSSTEGGDHVLVPWRGDYPVATARLGAGIAAAHDTAKVVLFGVVDEADVSELDVPVDSEGVPLSDGGQASDERDTAASAVGSSGEEREAAATAADEDDAPTTADPEAPGDPDDPDDPDDQFPTAASFSAVRLETLAGELEREYGVPTEVVVASEEGGSASAGTVLQAAHDTNCDLIVTPYETQDGHLTTFIADLFYSDTDVLVHRSYDGRDSWTDVLVPVRKAGDVAHKMIDFATRLAGEDGRVSVCHCVSSDRDRGRAERMLGNLVETVPRSVETRISRSAIETYLARVAGQYDLVIVGSSADRSAASRFLSRPTFERIESIECDVAILDRNFRY